MHLRAVAKLSGSLSTFWKRIKKFNLLGFGNVGFLLYRLMPDSVEIINAFKIIMHKCVCVRAREWVRAWVRVGGVCGGGV